jgi:hypothetical protein
VAEEPRTKGTVVVVITLNASSACVDASGEDSPGEKIKTLTFATLNVYALRPLTLYENVHRLIGGTTEQVRHTFNMNLHQQQLRQLGRIHQPQCKAEHVSRAAHQCMREPQGYRRAIEAQGQADDFFR